MTRVLLNTKRQGISATLRWHHCSELPPIGSHGVRHLLENGVQLSPSTVTADYQCAVDIGVFVHKTVESSLHVVLLINAAISLLALLHQRSPSPIPGRSDRLLASHQGDLGLIPGRLTPDLRVWESCRTMPLVDGFSRGSPAPSARRCSVLTSITLIGSQDLDVTSRPNIFIYSHVAIITAASEGATADLKELRPNHLNIYTRLMNFEKGHLILKKNICASLEFNIRRAPRLSEEKSPYSTQGPAVAKRSACSPPT
ncbi:hypothetical protein PR048_028919 [Dryococelus australis]|uniref:Uncharacterized protein n=1 Tax=Dryococelus australis TaxID=614101 RepID=A0ABQ9GBX1_9NEOP|nr:hypothetical protein PR048_028919 [Dryococelus australis]